MAYDAQIVGRQSVDGRVLGQLAVRHATFQSCPDELHHVPPCLLEIIPCGLALFFPIDYSQNQQAAARLTRQGDIDVSEGARTSVRLALLGEDGPSGGFFHADQRLPW